MQSLEKVENPFRKRVKCMPTWMDSLKVYFRWRFDLLKRPLFRKWAYCHESTVSGEHWQEGKLVRIGLWKEFLRLPVSASAPPYTHRVHPVKMCSYFCESLLWGQFAWQVTRCHLCFPHPSLQHFIQTSKGVHGVRSCSGWIEATKRCLGLFD